MVAVIMSLGMAPAIVYLRGQHKLKERRLELEAKTGGGADETQRLAEDLVIREVHRAHAALAEQALHPIPLCEHLPRLELRGQR